MPKALHMHVEPNLEGASLVLAFEGWNDAGEAATSALEYLAHALKVVPLAEIDAEDFVDYTVRRPQIHRDEKGVRIVDWPCTRFQYGSVDATREVVLGQGVEPHLRWRHYCELVASFVARLRIHRVVLLGAYVADVVYSRPVAVTGFATRDDVLERIGVGASSYEGPTGIVGVLSERLARDRVELVSLWAGLPHYISIAPNPRGALALIQKVVSCLEIAIDEEPLRKEASSFEERISALVDADPELQEYVRQLKRREFAQ